MRNAFIKELIIQARQHPEIFLIVGDLGYSVMESFAEEFPDRFLNAGVAEQNMTGVAAGLASEGYRVFTYSIANFPTFRCLEQIRNDICYHNLSVTIVSVGGGLAYGSQGYSHHGMEDLAVMRTLSNMTVVAPGDPVETRLALKALIRCDGPSYLRIGKAGEPTVHLIEPNFQIGKAIEVREGRDVTLVATGGVLDMSVKAAEGLAKRGISASVLSMHTLQPFDSETILRHALTTGKVLTIEEHGVGGLASAVAEVLAQSGRSINFKPINLGRNMSEVAGDQCYLCSKCGLSLGNIVEIALSMCEQDD